MSTQDADILRRARARIEDPSRWTRGYSARDSKGAAVDAASEMAVAWCAYGACTAEGGDEGDAVAERWLVPAAGSVGQMPSTLNDDWGHTAVLQMFDRAIELAEPAA